MRVSRRISDTPLFLLSATSITKGSPTAGHYGNMTQISSFIPGILEASRCGGLVEGLAGVINYKLYENTSGTELCVWTVLVQSRKETIQVRLIHDGFTTGATINVFGINEDRFKLATQLLHGDRTTHTVSGGAILQIVYAGNNIKTSQGFSLLFEAIGPDVLNPFVLSYQSYNQNGAVSGSINYTATENIATEFVSFALHPEPNRLLSTTVTFEGNSMSITGCMYPTDCLWIDEVNWFFSHRKQEFFTPKYREYGPVPATVNRTTTFYSRSPVVVSLKKVNGWGSNFQIIWNERECGNHCWE